MKRSLNESRCFLGGGYRGKNQSHKELGSTSLFHNSNIYILTFFFVKLRRILVKELASLGI